VNELGIFAMTDTGMREVTNPSAIFLDRSEHTAPGTTVVVVWEGTRPLLVEIQALVDDSSLGNPRRVTVGFEQNRLAMLLAVLHRHGGIQVGDQDVFANVVGGVRVMETSADLALLLAVVSSLRNRPLAAGLGGFRRGGLVWGNSTRWPVGRRAWQRRQNTASSWRLCPRPMRPKRP
jgi:DNA repair protein RadA/Sms